MYMYVCVVCMYVCITHNHKVIVEALISERIVNDVSESNSIVVSVNLCARKGYSTVPRGFFFKSPRRAAPRGL